MRKVTIIGAGLVGSLMAIYLAKRGYQVVVFEARSDPRTALQNSGRSINLAMSCRGLTSLSAVGLLADVEKLMVPMRARAIHEEKGPVIYQPFGRHPEEYINAIQRNALNNLLINKAEADSHIQFIFDAPLQAMHVQDKTIAFTTHDGLHSQHHYDLLIAADGAGSFVRESLAKEQLIQSARTYLGHGYKELHIAGKTKHQFAKEHLHLWPRNAFLLLGNPNLDNSITGSLFMPKEGDISFASLNTVPKIQQFFKQQFNDAYEAMPQLMEEMLEHPLGNMSTVNCFPWFYQDQCLLIGDAAHGIVPFFGQGMNCGFEDCRLLNQLLDTYHDDWRQVMPIFSNKRKINSDAVARMSMDNYHEIHENIRDPQFNFKKQIEQALMQRYPDIYTSKHVLVMFTNTSYAKAQMIGDLQQDLLRKIAASHHSLADIDWAMVDKAMEDYKQRQNFDISEP